MALNDFTDQNIQDTYQKIVQTDGTNLADGTGSLLPISFDGNNVTISGSFNGNQITTTDGLEVSGVFKIPGFNDVSSSLALAVAGGDNLGNHTATQAINLDNNAIFGITNISASGDIIGNNLIGTIRGGTF